MIDICVNLQNSQFGDDQSEILERSAQAGITGILACATDLDMVSANKVLCEYAENEKTGHNY